MEAHRTNQLTTERKKNKPKTKTFLRILRMQDCSKDSNFSKGQEINTSDSGFKPLNDSHTSMWLTSKVFTKENYK